MLTISSPATRPAVAAGESGWTAPIATPMVGSPLRAMPVKMANASRTFMTTPATRMTIFFHHGWTENERGSSARVAVLALELDEAADGQPVERVEGLALVAQDLRAGREADAELEHAHVRQPGRHEVADLVDDHEDAEDRDEQDDRDDRLDETGHALTPMGPRAKAARTSASRATRSSTSGAAGPFRRSGRRPPRAGAGWPGSRGCRRGSARRRRHRRRSGRPRRAGPARPASRAMRSAGNRGLVGRAEVEAAGRR